MPTLEKQKKTGLCKIVIDVIPHNEQRYPTVGDWFYSEEHELTDKGSVKKKVLHIRISELSDWRHEACIALHELFEVLLCQHAGISQEAVDKFDKKFELEREAGLRGEQDEPGDDPKAPYRVQHGLASGIERIAGAELGVDWNAYANEVNALP